MRFSLIALEAIKVVIVMLVVISGFIQAAENQGYSITQKEKWIIEKDAYLPINIPTENISNGTYYLSLDKQIIVDDMGQKIFSSYSTYIVNRSGVDENAQINIYYDPTYESIAIHSVTVRRDDIQTSQLKKAKITELRAEPELANLIYNGETQINIILNDVRVGDVVEYSYTREGANPVYDGLFSYTPRQQWNTPVFNQTFRLFWLKNTSLYLDDSRANKPLKKTQINDGTLYEYEIESSDALILDKNTPKSIDPYERVYFTEAKTWRDVVTWALPLYEKSISQNSQIQQIALKIKEENSTGKQQVAAALSYVQDNIRYFGIELGRSSHQPSNAITTLNRRYGDCKDKAVLFISILNSLGIKAYPALVNTEVKSLLKTMPPMYSVFDHVIVKVELSGENYWLDPTRVYQYGQLESLYQPNYESSLVINRNSDKLTDVNIKDKSIINVSEEFDFIDDQNVIYTIRSMYRGREAEKFYNTILTDGLASIQDGYLNYYKTRFDDFKIKEKISVSDYERNGILEMIEKYHFKVDASSDSFSMSFDAYNIGDVLKVPEDITRSYNYELKKNVDRTHDILIKLPSDDYYFNNYSYENNNEYFSFNLNTKFDADQNELNLSFKYKTKSTIVDHLFFEDYVESVEKALNNTSYTVSNESDKTVQNTMFAMITLDSALIVFFVGSFIVFLCILIWMVLSYFYKKRKGIYSFDSQYFYPISRNKYILMNVFTLGLFNIFWSYKNWVYIEKINDKKFWNFPRSVFYNIMFYSFNNWINKNSVEHNAKYKGYSADVAIVIFVSMLYMIGCNFYVDNDLDIYIMFAPIIIYYPFVRYINTLNIDKGVNFDENSKISFIHYALFIAATPTLLYTVLISFNFLPSGKVIEGDDLYNYQLNYFRNEGVIDKSEIVMKLSSSAMFDLRANGSGFTGNTVFRYWQEDNGDLYYYSKSYSEIVKIETRSEEDYTVMDVYFSDTDYFDLYILSENSMDIDFVEELTELWHYKKG